eukprot:TRINITY_DN126_c0_g1_i7.p1 TRINITY_DN126_c0_g1~~TRINITY_DN126_c0_g1_i7.p1  ORF type:complete len:166 (+),score=21.87 TRINITY_DN126_c0_g1_i7:174-671(+)
MGKQKQNFLIIKIMISSVKQIFSNCAKYCASCSASKQFSSTISTDKAPAAVGPYSQGQIAKSAFNLIFLSGVQVANGNESMTVPDQTKGAMNQLKDTLEKCNSSINNVIKTTIYITDMSNFGMVNTEYQNFFKTAPSLPARSCVAVKELPYKAKVLIELIAKEND